MLKDAEGNVLTGLTTDPDDVQISIPISQRFNTRDAAVHVVITGTVAPGYWISNINVEPKTVTLLGPPEYPGADRRLCRHRAGRRYRRGRRHRAARAAGAAGRRQRPQRTGRQRGQRRGAHHRRAAAQQSAPDLAGRGDRRTADRYHQQESGLRRRAAVWPAAGAQPGQRGSQAGAGAGRRHRAGSGPARSDADADHAGGPASDRRPQHGADQDRASHHALAMRILIDATPLQTGHRERGVGTYTRELLRALLALDRDNEYLLLVHPDHAHAGRPAA